MSAGKLTEAEEARLDDALAPLCRIWSGHGERIAAAVEAILAEREASLRAQIAADIEAGYLGADCGRSYNGQESPDAPLYHAYDEGLEVAARIARGVG